MTVEPAGSPDPTAAHVPYGRLILAGIGAGAVVFGLGSRVAMRVVGLAASPEHVGEPTAFGIVGRVTVAGVVGLVIMGSIAGLFTGLAYLAVRSVLPGGWGTRGLTLGLLLLPPVGLVILASSRNDFGLTSPGLIIAVFAAMILLEGLATAWSIERLGRATLPRPRPRTPGYLVIAVIVSLGFVALGASLSDVLSSA